MDQQPLYDQPGQTGNVPLLLKPNGAPVFQNVTTDSTINLNLPGKMRNCEDAPERMVTAHNFVAGKQITN